MHEFDSQRKSAPQAPSLPHNIEAEQGLLGFLLFDNRLFDRVSWLTPGMFFDPVHGRIFKLIAELIRSHAVADAVSLKARFEADGGIKEIGGAGYLLTLSERGAVMSYQALGYADLIRDLAQRRELFDLCQRTAAAALNVGDSAEDIVETIRRSERDMSALIMGGKSYVSLREAGEGIVESLSRPAPSGVRSGLAKLDKLLGGAFYAPDFVIIAGRPAMGKTALADNVSANIASSGRVVGSFSMEMDPDQIAARVLSRRSSNGAGAFQYSRLRSFSDRPRPQDVSPLVASLPETLLIDPTGAQTLAGIEASARAMKRQMGQLDVILVDYLQLMRDARARRDGRTQELSEITAGLKALAKRLGVPVIALSQLSRAVEQRADKRPQLSDLRESGSIEQDADIVLFVYREHYYLERDTLEPYEDESEIAFDKRKAAQDFKLAKTANEFEIFVGKNRHSGGGSETLWCDLAMDSIADSWDYATPRTFARVQDGAS